MDFIDLARERSSVRAYRSEPVEQDALERILEAGRLAPTADNRQPFEIIVIRTQGHEHELQRIYRCEWFARAPLILAVCAAPARAWTRRQDGKSYAAVDAAIVMDHMILAAAQLGLGTCWVAAFDPRAAREILALPPELEPVAFTPLGHPAEKPGPKRRKPIQELVREHRW